jgi:hypothetical protein
VEDQAIVKTSTRQLLDPRHMVGRFIRPQLNAYWFLRWLGLPPRD